MESSVIAEKKNQMQLIHSYPIWLPQTQTWMYNQVEQVQRLGVKVHVVCERTESLDQFAVDNIHSLEHEALFKQVWDKGLRKLRIRRHLKYLTDIGTTTGANIIHSHFGNVGWSNLGAVRKLNAKHVVTFYGMDVNQLPVQHPVWHRRYHRLFSEADRILCEGTHMAQCITNLGCPESKIRVQHLGVDVDKIMYRPRRWHSGEPLRVLIAASFREKKGIPYAIEALQTVSREVPVRLTIIGDAGNSKESIQEKTNILKALGRSGLKDQTRLLGYQTHEAMLREAYDHHLFLQPSITAQDGDTEGGAPVSIIEMLATGMLVVSTNHCDIPEVMGPAFSQLLAPERDAIKLAGCIQYLLNESDSWPSLAEEGRKRVECEYHWLRQAERLSSHYAEILE